MRCLSLIIVLLLSTAVHAQPKTDALLSQVLHSNKDSLMQAVLKDSATHRLQVIYTQINRDKNNVPSFHNYYHNVDSLFYFNPASTVKLPLALLSLEKLNEMHAADVNKFTSMLFDSGYSHETTEYEDSTAQNKLPSIAQFIRKAFLVSDNDAYNRMYEFVGQQTINRQLHDKGYKDVRITRRFMRLSADENRHTNPIRFIKDDGTLIYQQPLAYNKDSFDYSHTNKVGKAYINANDSLINEPIDFTTANNLPLYALQQMLQSVMFPQSVPAKQRFNLTDSDYHFLWQYLSQYPSETNYPKYNSASYYDSYVKFFFRDKHNMPEGVRVFNKVGWAYGFLTDVSYVTDFKHNVEYMLTATIYANSDGVLNDDKYDDETVSWPFLYQLGQTIYNYKMQRKRAHKPNLSTFKIKYEKRINDERPVVKNVDN